MRRIFVAIVAVIILLASACGQRQRLGTVAKSDNKAVATAKNEETSALRELMSAVREAEASAYGKGFEAQKAGVADTAKRIFSSRRIEDFSTDPTAFGKAFHKVKIREGVFVVTGHNYWWKLTPIVEDGQVKEVHVQASPICFEVRTYNKSLKAAR